MVVLHEGYARPDGVASTVGYVEDGDVRIVVDPGMVPTPEAILAPLRDAGCDPAEVTDVVLSHHHPDHTMYVGLFAQARVHDHWAVYQGDVWRSRPGDGAEVSPSVRLLATPGHSHEDVTTLVATPDGLWAFTHLWWHADGPAEDPRAVDADALHRGRARVVELADVVVPGHGAAFRPDQRTPM